MNSGKRISAWWNSLVCFFLGHTLTNVCTRCGKVVNLKGKKRDTLEDRINAWYERIRAKKIKAEPEYKGSIGIKPGLIKYELNLATDKLRRLPVDEEKQFLTTENGRTKCDKQGNPRYRIVKRKAEFNACCVYIDAMNDDTAISKANKYLFGRKKGVVIKAVENPEPQNSVTVTV